MRIMLGSLSGFRRVSIGNAFSKNYTKISKKNPEGFKGFLRILIWILHGFPCGVSRDPMGI